MQLNNLKTRTRHDGNSLFFEIEPEDPESVNEYLLQMLTINRIDGLVPVRRLSMDGKIILRYDLSDVQKIDELSDYGDIGPQARKQLIRSFLETQKQLPEYFIRSEHCVFDLNYVFFDDRYCMKLLCVPVALHDENNPDIIRAFLHELIRNYFSNTDGVIDNDSFMQKISGAISFGTASLERLCELAGCSDKMISGSGSKSFEPSKMEEPVRPRPDSEPVKPEPKSVETKPVEKEEKKKEKQEAEKKKNAAPVASDLGFLIPGGIPEVNDSKKKNKKEKPEKLKREKDKPKESKGKELKDLFSKNKKAPEERPAEAEVTPEEKPADKRFALPVDDSESAWEKTVYRSRPDKFSGTANFKKSQQKDRDTGGAKLIYKGNAIRVDKFPFTIGRGDCSLKLQSELVGRKHAEITFENGEFYVTDCLSRNGTYINNLALDPYSPYLLKNNTVINLADEKLEFVTEE